MQNVNELLRLPSPAPRPLGVAFDGTRLWLSSLETERLYAMDPAQWTLSDQAIAPGKPFGIVSIGDELRVVVGEGEADDRYVVRFVPGHGFKDATKVACPDFTGSHLAYDGAVLYLSQFTKNCIVVLDEAGAVVRTIALERAPAGMTFHDERLYLVTVDDKNERRLLSRIDPRSTGARVEDLAVIPFAARGLAFDGTRFWSGERDANQIVAFTHAR
ncbi:MAG: YncE family protein [Vulcanimicrobiaceae bacterium]